MILTTEIKIKTTNKNITYYKTIYSNIKSGDIIKVLPEQLLIGSHEKIQVNCDICGKIKLIEYRTYYNLTNKLKDKYYCNDCKWVKTKETNLEKYGFDNTFKLKTDFTQTTTTKEKRIKINIERYGVISYLKLLPNNHNKNHNKLKETVSKNNSKIFFEKVNMIIH